MRKVISTVAIILCFLCFAATAQAATINIVSDPAQITGLGTVTLRFTIYNDSSFTMRNLKITGYGIADDNEYLGETIVYPEGSINFNFVNLPVTAENYGTTVVYKLTWNENDTKRSAEGAIQFGTASATPPPVAAAMTATRTASKSSGRQGEKITLTYTLSNPGSVPMTDISIKDSIAGSTAIKSGLTLEAGGSTTATYEYTLGAQDAVSEPTITYKENGETKTVTIDKLTIPVVNVKLATSVTLGDPSAEGVLFTIVVKNEGNQTISGITVKDDLGNAVNADAFTLQAGQEHLLSYPVKVDATRVVAFVISGKDDSGQPYEDKTESYTVHPYIDPSSVSFQLATKIVENLDENGNIKVQFTIQNNSSVDLMDAVITEAQLGEVIPRMSTLPLGETVKEVDLKIGEPRELTFTVSAKDSSGAEHTFVSSLTAAYANLATPTPPLEEEEETQESGMSSTLVTILIVLAVLMALAGIALLVLSIYERKRNAEMDALDVDGYGRAPRAQTAPAPPPKKAKRPKKQKKKKDDFLDEDEGEIVPQNSVRKPAQQAAAKADDGDYYSEEGSAPNGVYRVESALRATEQRSKPAHAYAAAGSKRAPKNAAQHTNLYAAQQDEQFEPQQEYRQQNDEQPQYHAPAAFRPEPVNTLEEIEPEWNEPARESMSAQEHGFAEQSHYGDAAQEFNFEFETPQFAEPPQYPPIAPRAQMPEEAPVPPAQHGIAPEAASFSQPVAPPPALPIQAEEPLINQDRWVAGAAEKGSAPEPLPMEPLPTEPLPTEPSSTMPPPTMPPPAQKPQANLGVRNRIHRVRPMDDK